MDDISTSRSSIAELKLIQEHPEDEMSRILHEFEQNNSLIEKKDSVPCIPEFGIPEFPQFGVPEFTYQNNATAIATKFSDVTSPNCHDGFEEDELMIHPDYLSRRGGGRLHRTELLSPPSPVAAAAATAAISVAASFPLRSKIKKPEFSLASAHDIPDKIELEDDNDDGAQNGRIGQSFVAVNDAEIEDEKEVSSVAHVVEEELMVKHSKCPQDNTAEHCGLSRRKMKVRGAKKEHFHDDILRAVSMLSASPMHDSDELLEVTSILSQYEEAGKKAKDNHMKANEELMEAKRKNPDEDESGAPLDEKLNQQMWGCATWLCVQ
ncbi:hypothetical protein ACHAW5_001272 [Stephanodiscus triporus]|uniref:Uncharacterized protein n=1 Tax=Stephanodiscus triporus TaxID=2934178 RepID=A0ABD3QNQ5_9STRA